MKKTSPLKYYKNKRMFFIWDLAAIVLIVAAVVLSIAMITNTNEGEYVEIYHRGQLLEVHSLWQNKTIEIDEEGHNTIIIEDGQVFVSNADCPDNLCVKSQAIRYSGQRIVCAPNGLVIIIRSDDEIDGISGGGQ